jgi:UDP-N-acetylmuramoyl-L-alanyl-D-glutamate--2,6-diaminopimelate ligase
VPPDVRGAGNVTKVEGRSLEALPSLLGALAVTGALRGEWSRVEHDSRRVKAGDLFVAVSGLHADGHAFVATAARRGAAAAIVEREVPEADLPQIRVSSARRALACLAAEESGHPSREMVMVGVTGTNGKTTTAHLVRGALEERGDRVGFIGTVGYEFGAERLPAPHTTPEAPDLERLLRSFRDRGATAVAMEVSSHALALERTYGVAFDVGVFTNLTQDHLDFHGTLDSYREAKARLFRAESRGDRTKRFVGAINMDDEAGVWIRSHCDGDVMGYGMSSAAEVRAEEVVLDPAGTRLRIRQGNASYTVSLRLRGEFNAMNALAAFAACRALDVPPETIAKGLAAVAAVPGRLEPVERGQPFQVLVDYAHTPDALRRALEAVRGFGPRRLRCVFGCGGDRDRGKRPLMGAVAARLADDVILTSDNPRSEDPTAILAEIERGTGGATHVRTIADRAEAIRAGIEACGPGDALLIAGKGHETYQIVGTRTLPFDDREEARRALEGRGYAG